MPTIINMTPHDVNICDAKGNIKQIFPRSGYVIRLESSTVPCKVVDGVRLTNALLGLPWVVNEKTGDIASLTEQVEGTYYIVSQMVKSVLPRRDDLLVPAEVVRSKGEKRINVDADTLLMMLDTGNIEAIKEYCLASAVDNTGVIIGCQSLSI